MYGKSMAVFRAVWIQGRKKGAARWAYGPVRCVWRLRSLVSWSFLAMTCKCGLDKPLRGPGDAKRRGFAHDDVKVYDESRQRNCLCG
jgi:hypothetical protein